MRDVPTLPTARPIKLRYVYKRKYNKDGTVKKYKTRLVALGYGQVSGVDVFQYDSASCNECNRAIVISYSSYY